MDPKSLENVPSYLVLAYTIKWEAGVQPFPPPDYYLMDFRAYQRPEQLGEEGLVNVAKDFLFNRYNVHAEDLKIKVIEG